MISSYSSQSNKMNNWQCITGRYVPPYSSHFHAIVLSYLALSSSLLPLQEKDLLPWNWNTFNLKITAGMKGYTMKKRLHHRKTWLPIVRISLQMGKCLTLDVVHSQSIFSPTLKSSSVLLFSFVFLSSIQETKMFWLRTSSEQKESIKWFNHWIKNISTWFNFSRVAVYSCLNCSYSASNE